ncbi:MAG TPA: ABC transporter permease subunit [Candidatus Dormibacteraeota bacterium]|nr:ABC transporter permease subunit [Candidatus Dormibacteraeota bacterium]
MTAVALALRLGRWGILGFTALAFVSSLIQALGFYAVVDHDVSDRLAFAQNINILASRFTVLLAPPVRPDTVEGYVQYRSYGGLAALFAAWAMVSASGALRGDEERGLVEAALATGTGRAALIVSKVLAYAAGSLAAALAAGLGLMVGAAGGGESVAFRGVLEAAVVLVALAVCCYSLTLLIVQFTAARVATATAGIVLLILFLDNSLSRTFPWLSTARWLSPALSLLRLEPAAGPGRNLRRQGHPGPGLRFGGRGGRGGCGLLAARCRRAADPAAPQAPPHEP